MAENVLVSWALCVLWDSLDLPLQRKLDEGPRANFTKMHLPMPRLPMEKTTLAWIPVTDPPEPSLLGINQPAKLPFGQHMNDRCRP